MIPIGTLVRLTKDHRVYALGGALLFALGKGAGCYVKAYRSITPMSDSHPHLNLPHESVVEIEMSNMHGFSIEVSADAIEIA